MIRVKAIQLGYFNHRRIKVGDIFEIRNMQQFSKHWMVKVGKDERPEVSEPGAPVGGKALSQGARNALHEGKIDKPGDTIPPVDPGPEEFQTDDGEVTKKAPKSPSKKSIPAEPAGSSLEQTTGDEEVI